MTTPNLPMIIPARRAWNRGRIVGQKRPLLPKHVWAIRVRLELADNIRDLALFNMAIDSKLRGCDLVRLRVIDVYTAGRVKERTSILQSKTKTPVQFEITEGTRRSVSAWIDDPTMIGSKYLWSGRFHDRNHISTRQYARLLKDWVTSIGFPNAPLVVLNSCVTGRTRDHGGRREDLVQAFLSQGAGAVIASAVPVYDSVGEALGRAIFSAAALAKPMIGALVVEARRQLAADLCNDIHEPTWGAWGMVHLHGNAAAIPPFCIS